MHSVSDMENQALADFAAARGRILLATEVSGFRGSDSVEVYCDPPARVRVVATPKGDVLHRNDGWLDPYWNVEMVDAHPALEGVRSLWVFGKSYHSNGEVADAAPFEDASPHSA